MFEVSYKNMLYKFNVIIIIIIINKNGNIYKWICLYK